jgi:glyoxylase-like metal-dependent hydrolase (beta-lactamase superfamily II)
VTARSPRLPFPSHALGACEGAWLRIVLAQFVAPTFKRLVTSLFALFVATLVAGCAMPGAPMGAEMSAQPGAAVQVAPGVYMLRGAAGEIGPANLGRVGNTGFIVGPGGVLVIDTGVSYRQGRALLDAIASVTDQPVRRVLITHTRQEFLFGAAAFRERGIPIQMHRATAQLMAARCENCLKTLKRVLGDEEMRGAAVIPPDLLFDHTMPLDVIGRPMQLLHFGHSSGPGDTALFDERSGVLFAGGLLDQDHIPDVQDSDPAGWKAALNELRRLPIKRVVPGHGPAAPAGVVDSVARYLDQLEARMLGLLNAGAALSEAADQAVLPDYTGWDQYDTIHRRNASIVYVRLERELLFK